MSNHVTILVEQKRKIIGHTSYSFCYFFLKVLFRTMYYSRSSVQSIKMSTLHTIEPPAAQWVERLISNSEGRKFDSHLKLGTY